MAAQLESTARLAATGEAGLPRPLLDVRAGLTSGHAFVKPNGCEADVEQSRCRLFAPAEVPAATRAAPRRPCIPQAVQTPAIVDEVSGSRWTTTPVRPCNRRSATTSARSGSTPTAERRSPRKQAGGGACRRTSPRRMVQPRRRPLPGRPASRARQGAGQLLARYALHQALGQGFLEVAVEIVATRGPTVGAGTGLQRP